VDKMFTILPFETAFYAKHKYAVEYVGNPSIDSVCSRPNQDQTFDEFCKLNMLSDKPIIALLAGSRKQEISACLPRMIEAAAHFPEYQIVVAGAPGIDTDFYIPFMEKGNASIVFGQTYELLQQSKAAVVNSGTATLETALVGIPQVVVYHQALGRLAYWIKDIVIKVKYISLVNLVAEHEVVKELIAHLFTVENIELELNKLLNDVTYRQTMLEAYSKIRKDFGESGTAERAAKKIIHNLQFAIYNS